MIDLLDRKTQQGIVEALTPNGDHIGERFFPMVEEPTTESIWDVVKPGNGLAAIRAVDGEAKVIGGKAFDRKSMEIADIAAKRYLNINDLRALREAGETSEVQPTLANALRRRAERRVTEAIAETRGSVDNMVEYLRIKALQGVIAYSDTKRNIKISLDYGVPSDQKEVTPSVSWATIASSVPFTDILTWKKKVQDVTGLEPTEMILSRAAMYYLAQSASIRGMFQYTKPVFTPSAVQEIIENEFGLKLTVYEARYLNSSNVQTRFLAENIAIMLPNVATLTGSSRFADMPYVPHPLNDYSGSYYAWNKEEVDPYRYEVGTGLTSFPRIYQPETILTAKLWP